MTDRELMQMALDALEKHVLEYETIEALRTRLSQCERCGEVNPAEIHTCTPKVQEPVAWGVPNTRPTEKARFMMLLHSLDGCQYPKQLVPLYTAPPQREWQTLTENEIKHLWYEACQTKLELTSQLIVHLARNIEAKLKEKNGAT